MSYRAAPLALLACVALLVTPLTFLGGRMLYRAGAIEQEQFQPATPLEGPYTDGELRAAEGRLASFMPADEFLKGVTRQQLESAAEAMRGIERARNASWEERRPERLALAGRRRVTGRTLLALAGFLLVAWGLLAWTCKPAGDVQS